MTRWRASRTGWTSLIAFRSVRRLTSKSPARVSGRLDGLADGDGVDSEQVGRHLLRADPAQTDDGEQDPVRTGEQGCCGRSR
jgi:hypothetical protein